MKKTSIALVVLIILCVVLVSCSGSSTTNTNTHNTGLKFRVFVSNPLLPTSSTANTPALNIVDASKDMLNNAVVTFTNGLTTEINNPGLMVESPDRKFTLVYSDSEHSFVIVDNTKEALSTGTGSSTLSSVLLPDSSESMFIGIHNDRAYAAVPNAPVTAIPPDPGAIKVIDLGTNVIAATIPVAGVRHIFQSHDGNHILALSDNTSTITMISPSLIGTTTNPIVGTLNTGFDHPVWAILSSDDSTAYVLNCGAECGGSVASVAVVDVTHATPVITATIPVPAATMGLLTGSTLYVAGTPPTYSCTPTGLPNMPCGLVTVVNVGTQTVVSQNDITDGHHTRMEMSANGQVFIGAKGCTNIVPTGASTVSVGCLNILKPSVGALFMPQIGDVTGIQPIDGRNVVYVCQNHHLWIYDTTTDQLLELQKPTGSTGLVGDAVDVKLIDF